MILGRRVTMAEVAEGMTSQLGVLVRDKTGLQGDYDIDLRYVQDDLANNAQVDGPSLFDALQEQLGLKLEKQTGPVEILIVDHMEKVPIAN